MKIKLNEAMFIVKVYESLEDGLIEVRDFNKEVKESLVEVLTTMIGVFEKTNLLEEADEVIFKYEEKKKRGGINDNNRG